jgi:LacI family transcriptional regulator
MSTIREIARHTGLSTAAVSQALRGIGRLSPAARERVRRAAEELGYRPDPVFAEAFSRARQPADRRYRETLAYLVEWETAEGFQVLVHRAVREQAERLGYGLEPFIVSGRVADQRRVNQILRARGIRGLVINPRLGNVRPRLRLEWEHFAAVAIGRTIWHPRNLHRVESAEYNQFTEALHLLKKAGYRRIGMAVESIHNAQHNGIYYAAYLHMQLRLPPARRLPIFAPTGEFEEAAFGHWLRAHQPDVLVLQRATTVGGWLGRLGLRVPEDISVFGINVQEEPWSGMRRDYEGMGRAAVEMVTGLLRTGERGLPESPRSLHVAGSWIPGATLDRAVDWPAASAFTLI